MICRAQPDHIREPVRHDLHDGVDLRGDGGGLARAELSRGVRQHGFPSVKNSRESAEVGLDAVVRVPLRRLILHGQVLEERLLLMKP